MSDKGRPIQSLFHLGEREVQERVGIRAKTERNAQRIIRDHLTLEHRSFFSELPFAVFGTADERGWLWASLVCGQPGFMFSTNPRMLMVTARPLPGDPLNDTLRPGADISILGILLETRRRNRLTGQVTSISDNGFLVAIDQVFGQCPRYIHPRVTKIKERVYQLETEYSVVHTGQFDARTKEIVRRSDTFFIASATPNRSFDKHRDPALGVDVSHRGGKPGFVRIKDERTLIFPDFAGNNHFNTVGNLVLNPRLGLLFLDFELGELAYLTGSAHVIWDGPEVRAQKEAQRLICFKSEKIIRIHGAFPIRFESVSDA